MKASYWNRCESNGARCELCPHRCLIREGRTGICRVRRLEDGELTAVGYGLASSLNLDPIEKKPLYHFHPGKDILSVGGWGCNFRCVFCQNWTISQQVMENGQRVTPERLVSEAKTCGSIGIAYTYNEPLIAFEFVRDCAEAARAEGLVNVLVTNGYLNLKPAAELFPLIDAANVDVKSLEDVFYREHCGGSLAPVLDFAAAARGAGCHVEITNLVIPGLNDSESNFAALAEWVVEALGDTTPVHLSAYRPQYKLDTPSTPIASLEKAYEVCSARLKYVYLGNVLSPRGQDTRCPKCGNLLINRSGYTICMKGIDGGLCSECGRPVEIVL
ncbi:MAG: AmmeMemoRadiSam system radical SAM enzyme [Kiritimatiellia bacterium]|nr:AmmeMemoRadiSam system radical SAM enzyme [Kiritimatiellia bacterium]MDP6847354.1 AmmeMemoRadiSam system radical SAM enzyme [Kiritimatiellia bacterium]